MKTYVAEIAGEPIVAFRAKNRVNALSLARAPAGRVRFALIGADHVHKDGRPLWDGKSDIGVRQATGEESRRHWIATFDARRDSDKIDKHLVVWLVRVVMSEEQPARNNAQAARVPPDRRATA